MYFDILVSSCFICTVNSLVGVMIKAWTELSSKSIISKIGIPKAAVLPVPV